MRLEPVEKPKSFFPGGHGTVATDGRNFYYEAEFWDSLNLDEQIFCWAHEVMHAATGHLFRKQGRDGMKWNIAGDLCINPVLQDAGLTAPKLAIFKCGRVSGVDDFAEHVYTMLPDNPSDGDGGKCAWVGPSGNGDSNGNGDGDADGDGNNGRGGLQTQADEWRESAIQAAAIAQGIGSLPGGLEQFISAMMPKVNWREKLRRWLGTRHKNQYNFLPPSRRYFHAGLYMPALTGDKIELAFIVDTSGSMYDESILAQALGEIRSIKQTNRVVLRLLDADTEVHQERFYDVLDKVPEKCPFKGGGGTNIQAAFDYLDKKSYPLNGVICYTDGYTYPVPIKSRLNVPVIWLMTEKSNLESVSAMGEKIYIPPK